MGNRVKGRDVVSFEFENSAGREDGGSKRRPTMWSVCSDEERKGEEA